MFFFCVYGRYHFREVSVYGIFLDRSGRPFVYHVLSPRPPHPVPSANRPPSTRHTPGLLALLGALAPRQPGDVRRDVSVRPWGRATVGDMTRAAIHKKTWKMKPDQSDHRTTLEDDWRLFIYELILYLIFQWLALATIVGRCRVNAMSFEPLNIMYKVYI